MKETTLDNLIIVGRKLIPREHVAWVEPYDPASNTRTRSVREFRARVLMVSRDSALIEDTPEAFAKMDKFWMTAGDQVATNPSVHFRVETFHPTDGFSPAKPYATCLLWRDLVRQRPE